jgi:hypothetical protein
VTSPRTGSTTLHEKEVQLMAERRATKKTGRTVLEKRRLKQAKRAAQTARVRKRDRALAAAGAPSR